MSKRLVLIDGHAVLFRAYYAYPPLNAPSGELVNAVYGFASIVLNVIRELRPTHIAVSFDLGKPTFRHKAFVDYKANRAETPQELIDQEGRVREVVEALNIPVHTMEGFEADDVIGTICEQAKKIGVEAIIVTGDKDALQLVDDDPENVNEPGGSVSVYIPGRNKQPSMIYDEEEVEKKFEGLQPEQVVDLKGLAGDPSDNIPGVKGVGNKTAIKLLLKFSTVEKIYEKVDEIMKLVQDDVGGVKKLSDELGIGKSVVEKLIAGRQSAFESKKLATIIRDVPFSFDLNKALLNDFDKNKVKDLFEELGFVSLLNKLPNDMEEQNIQEALF